VPDALILADTVRSPELRHELPLVIPDPFLYVERGAERHVVGVAFEQPRLAELDGLVFHPFEEFGLDELRRTRSSNTDILAEIAVRATLALGVARAVVPAAFPLLVADRLRAAGVELVPDQESFDERRRVKNAAELAGVRRAQAAAEAGMETARGLLRQARPNRGGVLELDGAPLTCERIKLAVATAFVAHDASADEFVVSHGPQAAISHHMGAGEIRAGEPVVIDLWPKDNASACYADMTRTFVVGDVPAEIDAWHALCREALERALGEARAGVSGRSLYDGTCELFEDAGYTTQRTKADGETIDSGFVHALGHGVGLAVHEQPALALVGRAPLVAGDVVAVEPGLYRAGFGGVRLEDLVLVGEDGAENLTRFPYGLEP
jgi:Xaa-Pro aminopeptidase